MEVLFTHGYFLYEDEKEQKIMRPYPPLGILYLSAWLDKQQCSNEVFDTTFSSFENLKKYLREHKPPVLAIYTNLMTKLNVIRIMKFVNEEFSLGDIQIVLGGPDIRHNVEGYLSAGANVLVIGEGEQTMVEIVTTITNGNTTEFGHIPGVAYYSASGVLVQTKEREKIKSVDELPIPNRHKIDMQPYLDVWKKYHGKSAMTMSTQRGCPYTCKWCSTAVYGQSYRRRSPALVADELAQLKAEYKPDSIWFVDDVFTVSHRWLESFVEEVEKKDAIIPFECITRADRMNEEVVTLLKRAGAFRIWIGAESGSQKVIDLMDRRVDVDHVKAMIQETRKQGLEAGTFIMVGYPGETEEDIKLTVDYLKDANPHHFTITVAYPIKGTSLYKEVEKLQTKTLDWEKTTDRDRDFERTFSRKYYNYAVKWVDNEVRSYLKFKKEGIFNKNVLKYKLKSIIMRWGMRLNK